MRNNDRENTNSNSYLDNKISQSILQKMNTNLKNIQTNDNNNVLALKKNKVKKYYLKIITMVIFILLAITIIVALNLKNISVGIASFKSGINVIYPEYQIKDYRFDPNIKTKSGRAELTYKNKDKYYKLIEQKSLLDSIAVEDLITRSTNNHYSYFMSNGLTIFQYSNNTEWINDGIFYQISSNFKLSDSQIKQTISSL